MQPAKDIKPQAVRWLWNERIPRGMISVVAGRPGAAKSLLAVHIAAQVSKRAGVIFSSHEDPRREVLRPRLDAAGANIDRVHIDGLSFPHDLNRLHGWILQSKAELIVLDPVAAHLSGGVSRHNDSIRTVSTPLAKIAEDTGVAIVLLDHVVKHVSPRAHPLQAISGSGSGLPAAARMAFLIGKDPDDDERVILCCVKAVGEQPRSMAFTLDAVGFTDGRGRASTAGFLMPESGDFEFDARRLLVIETEGKTGRPPSKRAAASEWLARYLFSAPEHERPAKEIEEDAKQNAITHATLKRAASDMGIEKRQAEREWHWKLPQEVVQMMKAGEDA